MTIYKGEFTLYGLEHYTEAIVGVLSQLKASAYEFDVKLILTEAIANAFFHGNNSDSSLPIKVRYGIEADIITFEIEDCGEGIKDIKELIAFKDDDILSESNRGLFLISSYADKLEYHNRVLKVEKVIAAKGA